jgi:hypothetical protein
MSFGNQGPSRKRPGITWPIVIVALIGLGFGLQSLWKDLFFPDPEFSEGYLIFSCLLDGLTVLACGAAIFLLLKAARQGKS